MIDVFSKFKSGVYVVTTVIDGLKYGWTVSWVSKVSFKPPLVMISIGKNKKDHEKFEEAEVFAVNVMGENGIEVARHFGLSSGENVNNFKEIDFIELKTGSPVLKECVGAIDCKIVKTVDAGDHVVFIGEVLDSVSKDGESILFSNEIFP
ncbi:MAG: flavin reductase [Nanoarchaeota archaeon]|nr:flavin reductase [Nanoarchaeota archaeon]|tara:strand:+ start:537 stop:986 length:450 start_codon:yes stop_codon:yes gene_type:complete